MRKSHPSPDSETSDKRSRGRPVEVSLGDVVKAIGTAPKSPSALASELNVARATLHRKMRSILEQGLVISEGRGRAVTYRLPTPMEQINASRLSIAARQAVSGERRLRLVLDHKSVQRFVDDLDLACRIGIGQFEPITESIRYRNFGAGPIASNLAVDRFDALLKLLKGDLLGFPANASHGIFSPHVHESFKLSWSAMKAVRHRLAWDRNPAGSIGVHHDEPMSGLDHPSDVLAYSCAAGADVAGAVVVIEAGESAWGVMIDHLQLAMDLQDGRFDALGALARRGLLMRSGGGAISNENMAMGDLLIEALRDLWAEQAVGWVEQRACVERDRSSAQAQVIASLRRALSGSAQAGAGGDPVGGVQASLMAEDEPMYGIQVNDLPAGFFVHRHGELYRVIGPSDSVDHLRIYAESASLQTAMLKAHNAINGAPVRASGL